MSRVSRFRSVNACRAPNPTSHDPRRWCIRDRDHLRFGTEHCDQKGRKWNDKVGEDWGRGRYQFADLDWQPRFSKGEAQVWTDIDTDPQVLYTVGPLGALYIPLALRHDVAARLRYWAECIEQEEGER